MQEQLNEVRSLITLRFGADCWNEIIAEKAKREREIRAAETQAALEKQQQQEEWVEIIQMSMVVVFLVVLAIAMISFAVG